MQSTSSLHNNYTSHSSFFSSCGRCLKQNFKHRKCAICLLSQGCFYLLEAAVKTDSCKNPKHVVHIWNVHIWVLIWYLIVKNMSLASPQQRQTTNQQTVYQTRNKAAVMKPTMLSALSAELYSCNMCTCSLIDCQRCWTASRLGPNCSVSLSCDHPFKEHNHLFSFTQSCCEGRCRVHISLVRCRGLSLVSRLLLSRSPPARPDWQPNAALLVWQRLNAAEERKTDFTAVRMLLALFLQHSAEPVQRLINRDALVTLKISLLVKWTEIVAQWFFMPANSQQVEKEDECFKLAPPQGCSRLWF